MGVSPFLCSRPVPPLPPDPPAALYGTGATVVHWRNLEQQRGDGGRSSPQAPKKRLPPTPPGLKRRRGGPGRDYSSIESASPLRRAQERRVSTTGAKRAISSRVPS